MCPKVQVSISQIRTRRTLLMHEVDAKCRYKVTEKRLDQSLIDVVSYGKI